jgi:hypothetical protein
VEYKNEKYGSGASDKGVERIDKHSQLATSASTPDHPRFSDWWNKTRSLLVNRC